MGTVATSRGAIGWLGACLAGVISAASFTLTLPHAEAVPFFFAGSILSLLPFFVTGFGAGFQSAILSVVVASLGVAFAMPLTILGSFIAFYGIPSALMVGLALRYRKGVDQKTYWYPEGYLMGILASYGCVLFILINVMMHNEDQGLYGLTLQAFTAVMDALALQINKISAGETDATVLANYAAGIDAMRKMLPTAAFFLPATLGGIWLSVVTVTGVAGQLINAGQKWNLRENFTLSTFTLPTTFYVATALAGFAGFLLPSPFNYVGANICIILCMPLSLVGFSVVHAYARTTPRPQLVLTLFYLLLTLMFWLFIGVIILGVVEHGLHLRQRLVSKLPKSV